MTPARLKKIRNDLGLSQMALSIKTNVSRYNISLFESGFRELSEDELKRINLFVEKEEKRGTTSKKG